MRDPRPEIETLRERIHGDGVDPEKARDLTDRDREVLIEFSDQLDLLKSEYSDHRHLKLLRHCVRIAEATNSLAAALEDRDAAESIVQWINRQYDAEWTNADYRTALRVFGKRVTRRDEPPESIAWVPTGTSNSHDPVPREQDMLGWEPDVIPMIEAATNRRDKALIAVQFDAGLRSGELESLSVGDVFDGEHGLKLHVDGKNGERTVALIPSTTYLQDWLKDHPRRSNPDAPLWCNLIDGSEQTYKGWLKGFKEPARRAGIDKPVNPTNFRKSNTRWLVNMGFSQSYIEDRQGRARGSRHTRAYMARFGEESSERRYAAAHGKDVETEQSDGPVMLPCPRCDKETPRAREFCMHCSQALDVEAKNRIDRATALIDDLIVEENDPDRRRDLIETRTTMRKKPGVIDTDRVHEFLSSFSEEEA